LSVEKAIEDLYKFYKIAAKNSAQLVTEMVEYLNSKKQGGH